MVKKQFGKLADVLIEKEISKREDRELIIHGLNTGLELIINTATTIVLGVMFGLLLESLIFSISFSLIRTYAGGYHCKKATSCYIVSSGMVILVLGIVKFTPSNYVLTTSIFILLISVPVIFKLAPIETPTKLLDEIERKHFRKKAISHLCVECVVIVILFLFQIYNFGYVMSLGVMMSAIMVFLQKQLS